MDGRDWLILDMNFLLWREFFSAGSRDPMRTVFGVLGGLNQYRERFRTPHMAFAFDRAPYLRNEIFPGYKSKRRAAGDTPEDYAKEELRELFNQVRTDMLPALGYGNILSHAGYEADDLMAAAAFGLSRDDRAVLISRDSDLYQLLDRHIAFFDPVTEEFRTAKWFRGEYHIPPDCWPTVRALAGCGTDEVPGMDGVGMKTAVDFLRVGGLEYIGKKKAAAIRQWMCGPDYARNLKLIELPFRGCPDVTLTPDPEPPAGAFRALCERYGLDGIAAGGRSVRYSED